LEYAVLSPALIIAIPALLNMVTDVLFIAYVVSLTTYFRRYQRMLVFTNQRVLVFESEGFYGFKKRFAREVPKVEIPVTSPRRYLSHFTWSRYHDLDEPMFIIKN
jgi:hypothetical protein